MLAFSLTSQLSSEYHDDVENLFFFNPKQPRVTREITQALADFGMPKLVEEHGFLRIRIGNLEDVQTVYALQEAAPRPVLIGVLVYYRRSVAEMVVIHTAIDHEYLAEAGQSGDTFLLEFLKSFREQIKRVKGVETLSFCYTSYRFRIR